MTAQQVQRARHRLRLTQEELAAHLGVSVSAVRHWEQKIRRISEPTARYLQEILKTNSVDSSTTR